MNLTEDSFDALSKLEARVKTNTPLVPTVSPVAQVKAIKMVVDKSIAPLADKLTEIESTLLTEQIKKLLPGPKGDKGDKGEDGKNGVNGLDGRNGKDGKAGKDGVQGGDGVSVVDAEIAADDHLVLKLSDGNIVDAGELPVNRSGAIISTQLPNNQVYVSATAPANPSLNDLWYDIS